MTLSKVMFIATANNLGSIQPALRDRMEIINVSGYTIEEKAMIAQKHFCQNSWKNTGLKKRRFKAQQRGLEAMVEGYTRESGVRGLEKQVAKAVRYVAKSMAMEEDYLQQPKIR